MKRAIRWLFRPFWRASTPIRRALMARFDARVVRLVSSTIEGGMLPPILEALEASEARLERIEALLARADRSASTMAETAEHVEVVLAGMGREIFRLQAQVEALRRADRSAVGGLTLLSGTEADGLDDDDRERSRVG